MNVTEAARLVLSRHPAYVECLRRGVANHSAISRRIYGEVAELIGEKPEFETLKMAVIRIGKQLQAEGTEVEERVREVLANSTIELKADVAVVTVRTRSLHGVAELLKSLRSRFVQVTQGVDSITIAFDRRDYEDVMRKMDPRNIVGLFENQAAIILISPEEIIGTPGVIAFVTNFLSNNGINLTQIISCHTDTIFVVGKEESVRAYELLKELIEGMRG